MLCLNVGGTHHILSQDLTQGAPDNQILVPDCGVNIGIKNGFECFIQELSTKGAIVQCTKAVRGTFVDNSCIKHEKTFLFLF